MSMGEYEYINTELSLAIQGNSSWMKAEEEERSLNREDFMASPRKKLRLTKEQSAILEDCYRAHNILTSNQKVELAEKLNLRTQQVDVWFQNRRARTKIKQVKMDCEYLKKLCDSLSDENQRLKMEMIELMRLVKSEPSQGN